MANNEELADCPLADRHQTPASMGEVTLNLGSGQPNPIWG